MCASLLLVSRRAHSSPTRRACAALSTRWRPDDCARSASTFSSEPLLNLPFHTVPYRGFPEVRTEGILESAYSPRLWDAWPRHRRAHRLEHGLHGFLSAQAASPFERAPGVEVDRELDRREQAFPSVITDLPSFSEQVAHRPEVGHDRTLEQSGELGHRLGVA